MEEFFQQLLDNSSTPIISAFLLGILTAISPCPLATNITAIGFISKDISNRHRIFWNGILYTVGRTIAYSGLGFIIIPILREGASIYAIQKMISKYGEMFIAPALILIGLFMLFSSKINLPKFGFNGSGGNLGNKGAWGAVILGVLFALAFCPTSGLFYFGMLMPMSAAEGGGYLLPLLYSIATGLPVVIVAWILAYSVSSMGKFYKNIQRIQKWSNKVIAILFIIVGIYFAFIYYL